MSKTTRPHQPRVCGECLHWKRWEDECQDAPVDKGVCATPFRSMFLTYPGDDSGDCISTYASFGCNHWESNNASEVDDLP